MLGLERWVKWVNGKVGIVEMAPKSKEKKYKGTMGICIYWPCEAGFKTTEEKSFQQYCARMWQVTDKPHMVAFIYEISIKLIF